ncbi:MAG TPA: hypothetical protein PLX67_03260, partial [bacterium]|nr:hypothetical protein [bacterium]
WQYAWDKTISPTSTDIGLFVTASSTVAADFRVDGDTTITGLARINNNNNILTMASTGDALVLGGNIKFSKDNDRYIKIDDAINFFGATDGKSLYLEAGSGDSGGFGDASGGSIYLNGGSGTRDSLDGNIILASTGGRVGIGTTKPGQILDVVGNASTTGHIYVGTSLYLGHSSNNDTDYLYFDAGAEYLVWNNTSDLFVLSNDLSVTGYATTTAGLFTQGNLRVGGNAVIDGSVSATQYCLSGDCITAWPEGGSSAYLLNQWLDTTNTPTFIGVNATTTNVGLLTVYDSISLPNNAITDLMVADNITASNYLSLANWFSTTTDGLAEGSSNLYYTTARVGDYLDASTTIQTYFSNAATAFSWGNHATAGYLSSSLAASTYLSLTDWYATTTWAGGNDLVVLGNVTTTGQLSVGSGDSGDSLIELAIAGVPIWVFGVDDTDDDRFVISSGGELGVNNRFVLDAAGNATTTGSIDASQYCLNGTDCITTWPAGGSSAYLLNQWLDTTNTPTFVGLNASSTNV